MILTAHCQQQLFIGEHTLAQIVHGRTFRGLGIAPALRRLVRPLRADEAARARRAVKALGEASTYHVGDWVRVLDRDGLRAKLDARERTRGLVFSPQQWDFCGRVARVTRVVRRIVDDSGKMRAVSRTVLLEGIGCEGVDGTKGCGRCCPLMFRDEWLEPAEAPVAVAVTDAAPLGWARVRPLEEIRTHLDWRGRHGGVMFVPEQAQYAGQRFRVLKKIEHVFEADRDAVVREPIYILDTPGCTGASLGAAGPCDRGCALLWHGAWLALEHTHERAADLERAASHAPAFLDPTFVRVTTEGRGELVTVIGRSGEGTAALTLRRDGRRLLGLATDDTPRYDMIGDATAAPALWAALRADASWDVVELEDVPTTSPLATTLLDRARADGFRVVTRPGLRSPWFPLAGFEERLTSKFRANLRRCAKNLGGATLERVTGWDEAAFEEAIAIELASWKGERGTAIGSSKERRHVYETLFRGLPSQRSLSLQFLVARGRRIAFEIVAEDATTHYAIKISFLPEFSAYSPGHLLIERAAAEARTRGLSRFDFMGWDQEWKRKWTDQYVEHVSPTIYRDTARGVVLYSARELVRPRLVQMKQAINGLPGT